MRKPQPQERVRTSVVTKLTQSAIQAARPVIIKGQPRALLLNDSITRGFGIRIGTTPDSPRTFYAQRKVGGRVRRVSIDKWGVISIDQARKRAQELLVEMGKGIDPIQQRRDAKAKSVTLQGAWQLLEETLQSKVKKGERSSRTVEQYRYALTKHLPDWMSRELVSISRSEVAERHRKIAQDVAAERAKRKKRRRKAGEAKPNAGQAVADFVFVVFRRTWNRAMVVHEHLPACPTASLRESWFDVETTAKALDSDELRQWYGAVQKMDNHVRRDYLVFAMLSGMRRTSIAEMKIGDIDFERRLLHVTMPKGGAKARFDLPLSDRMVALLKARREENLLLAPKSVWVFPADSRSGHIVEAHEPLDGVRHWSLHDLRRSFISEAVALNVHPYVVKLLVNHRLARGDDVTARYTHVGVEALRPAMQSITNRLLAIVEGPAGGKVVQISKAKARAR